MCRRCVLAADAELAPRTLAYDQLTAWGYEVLGVSDTDQLLNLLRRGRGYVLVFDADLLSQDELPFLQYLQTCRPALRTIATSANESLEWEAAVRQQGIFYYLSKPIDLAELRLVLADATESRGASACRKDTVGGPSPPKTAAP